MPKGTSASAAADRAGKLKAEGNDAFKQFNMATAIARYRAAVQAAPREPVFRANLSAALFEAGQYEECLAEVQKAVECDPSEDVSAKLALRRARAACWLARLDAARTWLQHKALRAGSALAAPAAALSDILAACEQAQQGQPCGEGLSWCDLGAGAPPLLRDNTVRRPLEMFVRGHDHPRSMLAGARACFASPVALRSHRQRSCAAQVT